MRNKTILKLLGIVWLLSTTVQSKNQSFFTGSNRVFQAPIAHPREARIKSAYVYDLNTHHYLHLSLGGDLNLFENLEYANKRSFLVNIRASIHSRFQFDSPSFDLINSDYRGGLSFQKQIDNWSWDFLIYHQSSHLGDETLEGNRFERIDFSYEALQLYSSYQYHQLRPYLGLEYKIRAEPGRLGGRWTVSPGIEWQHSFLTLGDFKWSLHTELHQEYNWDGFWTIHLEKALARQANSHRVFVEYFQGFTPMGQLLGVKEKLFLVGFLYDL